MHRILFPLLLFAPAAVGYPQQGDQATGENVPRQESPAVAEDSASGNEKRAPAEGPMEPGETADEDASTGVLNDQSNPAEVGGVLASLHNFLSTPPLGYLFTGGIFMWPILFMGVLGAGVIIERYRSLKMLATDSTQLRRDVQALLEQDQVQQAFDMCNQEQGPVPAVLATGLRKYLVLERLGHDPAKVEDQVVKSMDDYGVHIVAALERHLAILATISSAAPMLGFLGTVQGMIVAFNNIVLRGSETNIVEAAASGIMVSLMTTCFGLIVGIPAFVAFNYFTSVINRFVLDVEESATELIETVTLKAAIAHGELSVSEE